MKVITYDVGTTGFKTAMFEISSEEGIRLVADAVGHYKLTILPNGGTEQDPEDWWRAMCSGTNEVLEKSGVPASEVKGISFCSQVGTLVMVDEHGNALRPAMNIMDTRATAQFGRIMGSGVKVEGLNAKRLLTFLRITGLASTSAKDSVWRYLWVKENEPEIFSCTYKWIDTKEYLIFRATGKLMASRDDAYMTFLYDYKKKEWSRELCRMTGVNMDHLPEVCDSTAVVGELLEGPAKELGLEPGTAVVSGGTDISLCQVGAGAVRPGDVSICGGTSGWVCTTVDKMTVDVASGIGSVVCADPRTLLYTADCETTGKCLEWAKERLQGTPFDSYREMFDAVERAPAGSHNVVFSPWMHGNRCPFEDPLSRGVFFNVDVNCHSSDLIRAVVEGVAMHMRWLLETSERNVKTNPALRFVGGIARTPVVGQIMADVTKRTIEVPEVPEQSGTAGAAAVLAVAFGMLDSIQDVREIIKIRDRFEPDEANIRVYDRIFPVFKELYKANKKAYQTLNGQEPGAAGE